MTRGNMKWEGDIVGFEGMMTWQKGTPGQGK